MKNDGAAKFGNSSNLGAKLGCLSMSSSAKPITGHETPKHAARRFAILFWEISDLIFSLQRIASNVRLFSVKQLCFLALDARDAT
jgi:hypothetical protein